MRMPALPPRSLLLGVALLGAALLAGCQSAGTNDLLSVRAQAADATTLRADHEAPKTYVIAKGHFTRSQFDSDVRTVDFETLSKTFARHLGPRFVPVSSAARSDLVIVIHWGAIARQETSLDTLMLDPDAVRQAGEAVETAKVQAAADFKAGNYNASAQVAAAEANLNNEMTNTAMLASGDAQVTASTADLLGLRGLYSQSSTSPDADAARSLLLDDRYFVTLVAYDAAALKMKIRKVVWTTWMSVPLGGRDFAAAVRQMAAAGAPWFGRQAPRLILEQPPVGKAEPATSG